MNSNLNISVIGLGLIGGSMALECKKMGYHVSGVDADETHCEMARDLKLVSEIKSLKNACEDSDIIIIAIPVDKIAHILGQVLDQIPWTTTVLDAGSTKFKICTAIRNHPKRSRFVASHPLAGTEFSGPKAAHIGLFRNKKAIICEEEVTDEDALEKAVQILAQMGMQCMFMKPDDHDKHMAYVSHLSHVSSFALGSTVLNIEKDEKQIFNLASTGFESTVRLAKSSPYTWTAIFDENKEHLSNALGSYIQNLQKMKDILDASNKEEMRRKLKGANDIKRILNGIKLNIVKIS